jgi:hypothetical protein
MKWQITIALLLLSAAVTAQSPIQDQTQIQLIQPLSSKQRVLLGSFLKSHFHSDEAADKTLRYLATSVLLHNGDPPEIVTYVEGRNLCGSGGCGLAILTSDQGALHVLTETTVTQLPVRILNHSTNGWHDITVLARNGVGGDEVVLKFNGKRYPSNPTLQPGHQRRKGDGVTLFTYDSVPTTLYR